MAIWGALIGAAASAYSANRTANATSDAARAANALDLGTFREANDFNRAEADKMRWFNAEEAEKARAFSAQSVEQQQGFNAGEAAKERDWQKMMSDTSYQRAIGDMKAAGLNPMLAYSQGGASSGSGASATGAAASAGAASGGSASSTSPPRATPAPNFGKAELIANTASSFLDIDRKLAETQAIRAETQRVGSQTQLNDQQLKLEIATMGGKIADIDWKNKNDEQRYHLNMLDQELKMLEKKVKSGQISNTEANTEYQRALKRALDLGVPGLENQAEFERSMQTAPQYLKMITGIINAAQGARNLGR